MAGTGRKTAIQSDPLPLIWGAAARICAMLLFCYYHNHLIPGMAQNPWLPVGLSLSTLSKGHSELRWHTRGWS